MNKFDKSMAQISALILTAQGLWIAAEESQSEEASARLMQSYMDERNKIDGLINDLIERLPA